MDRRDVTREYRGTLRFITSFLKFPILLRKGPGGGGGVGGSGYTLCTGYVPPSTVCFSQFLSGKGVVFSPTVWQGSRFLSGKSVVFRPNTLARGVFGPRLIPRVASVNKRP